jgi:radical SAM superfamily enzyme YgiQ (UPF0313 family)
MRADRVRRRRVGNMRKVKVLLLDLKTYYPSPPYQFGLMVEYARLEPEVRNNAEFVFAELPRDRPAEDIARTVLDSGADLVAASNYAWSYKRICDTLTILEGADVALPRILLGGPNSSGDFGLDLMRRHRSISAMVEGEGEPAFRDICSALVDGVARDLFAGSRNCVVRGEDGEIRRPNLNHRIQTLDDVPSPYLSGLLSAHPSPIFYETNRGCPYRCSFCYWGNGNAKIYRMSNERIREEMEFFARKKVWSFWLADANFGIFKTDAAIAAMMAEINDRHGRPFKHVGVNWAKQSSDRVLEIARIFRDGGMGCTTTMALQSVTPSAEEASKRYSMPPSKFASLVSQAAREDLDTYTDIIWGLPGEDVEQFLDGLGAVVATGVPAILIHQLYLLPGTEFFEKRRELGLEMLSDHGRPDVAAEAQSDFSDYIVVGHPKMSREEMARGTRAIGTSHVLHNHDLGRATSFYLARHGIRHRQVLDFFDRALLGEVAGLPAEPGSFFADIRDHIRNFADHVGLDEYSFYYGLSDLVWFTRDAEGRKRVRADEVESFCLAFFSTLCADVGVELDVDERTALSEMIRYNALIAPKPSWRPRAEYRFEYDVHQIWSDMQQRIDEAGIRVGARADDRGARETWPALVEEVERRLRDLLTSEYLASRRRPTRYRIENRWRIPPILKTADWLLSSRSKHCAVTRVA